MDNLVSIIMPAYNAETYIAQSIMSVINQTYKNWELIIVDDGSTDNTASIVQKYAATDNRIKVISQQNKRLGAARNAAIHEAAGDWVAFLDADDLWDPSKLEKQLLKSAEYNDADVIFTSGWSFKNDDLDNLTHYKILTGSMDAGIMYRYEFFNNYIPVMSVLVKKAMVDKIGFQEENPDFYGCEDWDYWLRMALAGASFYGMEEQLFYYRRHNHNMSSNLTKMRLAQLAVCLKNYDPKMIEYDETTAALVPVINLLVADLVASDQKKYARKTVRCFRSIAPGYTLGYLLLLAVPGKGTVKYFYLFNRFYKKVKRLFTRTH